MLIQQMDNEQCSYESGQDQFAQYDIEDDYYYNDKDTSCDKEDDSTTNTNSLFSFFGCLWEGAKACSSSLSVAGDKIVNKNKSKFVKIVDGTSKFIGDSCAFIIKLISSMKVYQWPSVINVVWFYRIKSPIVQRLVQSISIHLAYLCSLLFVNSQESEEDE